MNWNFIDRSLAYIHFGDNFRRWVSTFYSNSTACVCNNGYSSGFFNIKRGVRQGCPLSPYLFIICADILSRAIIHNDNITGLSIFGNEIKVLQYADDTVIFLDGSKDSVSELFNTLNKFKLSSGLKVNFQKNPDLSVRHFCHFSTKFSWRVQYCP